MKDEGFAIFWNNELAVVFTDMPIGLPTDILDWYAENYAMERSKLSWGVVPIISLKGMKNEDLNPTHYREGYWKKVNGKDVYVKSCAVKHKDLAKHDEEIKNG